ncbi:unnamed protein product [Vitrella brassicaformis CCMP3155]|uniref:Thiol-disulfide oxidoreductase DCC n=2 Tax=Vitrella brassicaformis TaxID=1169539 RepID=A0A0G4GRH3_VITBC|nr:unnamed protein product [Vitrella brassicaformis CCMP3155]|eukprot:CEM33158.1 unnamed protein product [Vitrella brassicaformis CCMP3155]
MEGQARPHLVQPPPILTTFVSAPQRIPCSLFHESARQSLRRSQPASRHRSAVSTAVMDSMGEMARDVELTSDAVVPNQHLTPAESAAKAAQIFAADKRPVILFDGICNLCNSAVNFMLDEDQDGKFRFAALQSVAGKALLERCGKQPDDISSIVLVTEDSCYFKSEAVMHIGKELTGAVKVMSLLGFAMPGFVRNPVYDFVARNRYAWLGETDYCRVGDNTYDDRFVK